MEAIVAGWRVPARPGWRPDWLRVRVSETAALRRVVEILRRYRVNTVCSESLCPNLPRCWGRGEATFMILGDVCTRRCGFCAVRSGTPSPPDPTEPARVAAAVAELGLRYVVITSVDRDDLPDGGASVFAATVREVKKRNPGVEVEVLTPDFGGSCEAVGLVASTGPSVYGHNVETVERLTPLVRDPRASYQVSLRVLECARSAGLIVKTGVMLGLGEELDDLERLFDDLAGVGVDILTIGQYLRPTPRQIPVRHYVTPKGFRLVAELASKKGIPVVVAGPLVRSSFAAEAAYRAAVKARETGEKRILIVD